MINKNSTRAEVLAAVREDGYALSKANTKFRDDHEIVLASVSWNSESIKYASDRLKNNRKIVLKAIQDDSRNFKYASEKIRMNDKIAMSAIGSHGINLKYASKKLQNYFGIVKDAYENAGEEVLNKHGKLKIIKGDIRDRDLLKKTIPGHDAVIHLACISNDPSFELNPRLGKSINLDPFEPLVKISRESNVKRFIYASSSSVYGLKDEKEINEEVKLEPLTDYSRFKVECEKILQKYKTDDFTPVILRPATVCGYSPRQRLDVVVNILTNLAYNKREISVYGGNQLRPNIHISDMVNVYEVLIEAEKSLVSGEIFNAGYENRSVLDLANAIVFVNPENKIGQLCNKLFKVKYYI